jgi:hypothetical protein
VELSNGGEWIMVDQLYLERFVWFDHEPHRERFSNAIKLEEHFEIVRKTTQHSIDHFQDYLQAHWNFMLGKKICMMSPDFSPPISPRAVSWLRASR